jgi:excisionase family DNA binding protein
MEACHPNLVTESRLLGFEGAATYLDITKRSVYRLVERGIIRPVRLPGVRRTLFDKKDLDALIEAGKPQAGDAPDQQAAQLGSTEDL